MEFRQVARAGGVSIVNSIGAGVLENPGLVPYLPTICRALRAEDLSLATTEATTVTTAATSAGQPETATRATVRRRRNCGWAPGSIALGAA